MAGSTRQNRAPQGWVGRLFGRSKEEDPVWSQELMDAGHQDATRVLRKVEHDVTQEDDIEPLMKWEGRLAEVGLAEVAELTNLGLGHPVFPHVVEVANDVARGQTAIHLDAVVEPVAGAFDNFIAYIGALDVNVPACEGGKILANQHGERVTFLACGAGSAPEPEGARHAAGFDEGRQQFGPKQLEGTAVAEEARLVDGHCFGDRSLERRVLPDSKVLDKLLKVRHAFVPQ